MGIREQIIALQSAHKNDNSHIGEATAIAFNLALTKAAELAEKREAELLAEIKMWQSSKTNIVDFRTQCDYETAICKLDGLLRANEAGYKRLQAERDKYRKALRDIAEMEVPMNYVALAKTITEALK